MKNKKGFTLIELIIVISLLAVIAGMFAMNLINSMNKQKEEDNKDIVAQILSAANTYVSVNPEEIENLFNGYGYVDIPIGELRDKGLLKEDLKDAQTGKRIPDEEKIRVKLDLGDYLDFEYPVDKDTDAWKFIAEDIYIDYTSEEVDWCSVDSNVYTGLITDPLNSNYEKFPSKLYLMNNKEGDPDQARMFTGDYFDENGVNLRVTSCNVNPNKVGTYNITYKYFDKELGTEKTVNRVVYVNSSDQDVMGFTVVINKGQPIVRGTPREEVPILIKEIYRNGSKEIPITVGELISKGYDIADFDTEVVGDDYVATVTRVIPNSDGTIPEPQKPGYVVIPDTYTLTFNPGNGTVSPKEVIVTYKKPYGEMPTPTRTGYDFDGWFTESGGGEQVTSETIMMKLYDHTLYAHWTPKVFTVHFNPNGGSVGETSKQVTYDSTYGSMPTPNMGGYDFVGWYTAASGGNLISSNTVVQILADQTLYAHWTPMTYTVIFNSNGCGGTSQTSKSVSYGSSLGALPTTSKSDYIFNGWSTSPSGGDKVSSNYSISGSDWHQELTKYNSPSTGISSGNSSLGGDYNKGGSSGISSGGTSLGGDYNKGGSSGMSSSPSYSEAGKYSSGITLYAQCTYNPPPPEPEYTPSYDRPSRDDNYSSGSSGGSSTTSSCTPSCGNSCGDELAAGRACSNDWNKLEEKKQAAKTQAEKDAIWKQQEALHEKGQEHYGNVDPNKTYTDSNGVTTDSKGNQLSPTNNKSSNGSGCKKVGTGIVC